MTCWWEVWQSTECTTKVFFSKITFRFALPKGAKWEKVHVAAWNCGVCVSVLFRDFLERAFAFCADVTFINCPSFCESNAPYVKFLCTVYAIDVFCVCSVWVYAIWCCAVAGILCGWRLRWWMFIFTNVLLAWKNAFLFISRCLLAIGCNNIFFGFHFSSIIVKLQGISLLAC